jgi:hypothetical protein
MTIPPFLRALLALAIALLLPACAGRQTSTKFTGLRVSTYRGETLAEYVARGPIQSVEGGYKIHAVERHSGAPYAQRIQYPYGWDTTVLGPRIHTWPTEQPAWLAVWEDEHGEVESWEK